MFDLVPNLSPDLYFKLIIVVTVILEAVGIGFLIYRSNKNAKNL